jgi:hypothetical protein
MSWWSPTNVSVSSGGNLVTIVSGNGIETLSPTDALIIGNFTPVEIDAVYFNGSNNIIRLKRNWPHASQSNQAALAFPTDADLGEIAKALNNYLTNFQVATQAEMEAGTDNVHTATALGVKRAIDAQVGTAARLIATTSTTDTNVGRALKVGDFGLGNSMPITMDANTINGTGLTIGVPYEYQSIAASIITLTIVGGITLRNPPALNGTPTTLGFNNNDVFTLTRYNDGTILIT